MGIQQVHSDTLSNHEPIRVQNSEISLEIRQPRQDGTIVREGIVSRYGTPLSQSHVGPSTPGDQDRENPMFSQPWPIVARTERNRSQGLAQKLREPSQHLERWEIEEAAELELELLKGELNLAQERQRLKQMEAALEPKRKKFEDDGYMDLLRRADVDRWRRAIPE